MRSPVLGLKEGIRELFDKEFSLELFRRASFTRQFEFYLKKVYDDKGMPLIPIYLCIGQEFVSAALSMVLKGYQIFAQHRGHGIYLAFGGPPEGLRDELLGLPTGCCGGMAGSNAIQCPPINLFGHSGLMGEQVPIAVGAALASQKPTLAIMGDASAEEDYIYPSLGYAATKKLPILFVCEDNGLSILTPVEVRRNWSVANVAAALGMPTVDIADDPWLIAYHAQEMSKRLPGLINIRTVRQLWHAGTGSDGKPEWDRYQLVKEELTRRGHGEEVSRIERETLNRAEALWEKPLRKQ